MKYWLNGDSKNSRLPGVGAWVLSAVLPVFLAAAIAMVLMPMGNSWSRLLSLAKQVSGSGSALLSTLFSAQLGVSALVVAITQFQPGRWRATPQKLGKRWLGEMRRVSSLESRYFATSFGLIGISSIIVLGVAVCVLHNVSAGGVLLLVVAWGVHAVSSAVLNMVPATGVAVVDDYWRSLARLFYIAENWSVGLKKAKEGCCRITFFGFSFNGFGFYGEILFWCSLGVASTVCCRLFGGACNAVVNRGWVLALEGWGYSCQSVPFVVPSCACARVLDGSRGHCGCNKFFFREKSRLCLCCNGDHLLGCSALNGCVGHSFFMG